MRHIKQTLRAALLLPVLLFGQQPAHADEGMWTLYNLPTQVFQAMQGYGFTLPYDSLYQGDTALKSAVVNFSGYCSGVVVSPDGLVFTNHHCGFEAIRSHSTVEHDYMLNGFYAKNYAEELPNENMFVSFMMGQADVTERVNAMVKERMDAGKADKASRLILTRADYEQMVVDSLEQLLTDEARQRDSSLHVVVDAFYEGNKWYATTYQDFNDLRLVFAIPKSMGKFGGETDNWMWPRQTCDFSVFRIYADKNNRPAKYSADNVPYHPKRWARVSRDGYDDGSFAMTIGYPGSTERYLSSYGIKMMRDDENAPRAQVRGVKQEVMLRHMRADEGVRIKYDSKYANSSNYWKNSIGMNKCIDSIGIVGHKRDYELRIAQWQDTTKTDIEKVDFAELERLYAECEPLINALTNWRETFARGSNVEFNARALRLSNGMEVHGDSLKPDNQYNVFDDNSDEWDEATDKEMMAALLDNYRKHAEKKFLPEFYATIDKKFGGDCAQYVDWLYKKSIIMKSGKKIFFNHKSHKKDPGVNYALDVMDVYTAISSKLGPLADSIDMQERRLCNVKIRMEENLPHYSDANFTMRLSYGQVGGFDLGGRPSGYYTTAESIVEKMKQGDKGTIDYQAEPIMHQIMSAKDFTPYADKKTGKMHLCFLTNNDITGGNSGSPMFNGKGELIGLAFDGNWDSLSSDINFDKRLARCIGVDIRYVLFMMDRWGHADRLLKEIFAE